MIPAGVSGGVFSVKILVHPLRIHKIGANPGRAANSIGESKAFAAHSADRATIGALSTARPLGGKK